ncbi:hypothetical protein ASD11_15335 [Aeromicrobium sp. Root495]|uniref:hypothetical protein n=1 Tax=Aeromicrobium sp. Root495 TaxID=1736550 RepID=UPI00070237C1|nr:hypothetical protein [Aeromicrobium sp. Root495]KQY55867.1 hypothetical protein ASD11_15335 [Aeromicrobium sp. Root495]
MTALRTALVAVLLVPLTACGSGSGSDKDGDDFRSTPYYRVLYDEDASPRDVVSVASGPQRVEIARDGSALALFGIQDQEGGEESKTVWRLLDPEGKVVREDFAPQFTEAAMAGNTFFLVDSEADFTKPPRVTMIDPDGQTQRLRTGPEVESAAQGDVVVGTGEVQAVLRPGPRTVNPLAASQDSGQRQVDTSTGRLATLVQPDAGGVSVTLDPGGSVPITPAKGHYPMQLLAAQGTVALTLGDDMSAKATTEVWGGRGTGETAGIRRIGTLKQVHDPSAAIASDGSILVGDTETGWYRAAPTEGGFSAFDLPGQTDDVQSSGSLLVATASGLGANERGKSYVSDDAGDSWSRLDLGPGAP